MPGEQPVLTSNGHSFKGAFGGVVVDVEEPVLGVNLESFPLVTQIADGLGHGTAGRDQLLPGIQSGFDLDQQWYTSGLSQFETDGISLFPVNATRGVLPKFQAEIAAQQGVSICAIEWTKISPSTAWRIAEAQFYAAKTPQWAR